jgi:hypothetical protein
MAATKFNLDDEARVTRALSGDITLDGRTDMS